MQVGLGAHGKKWEEYRELAAHKEDYMVEHYCTEEMILEDCTESFLEDYKEEMIQGDCMESCVEDYKEEMV